MGVAVPEVAVKEDAASPAGTESASSEWRRAHAVKVPDWRAGMPRRVSRPMRRKASDRRGAITKAGNKHLRKTLVEAAWHYLTCSGRPKDLAKGQAPDRGARRHAAKGVRRLVERREALLARGVHGNKANVATARELACWVWAVGLMAEEA